jgi:hypothetical protein
VSAVVARGRLTGWGDLRILDLRPKMVMKSYLLTTKFFYYHIPSHPFLPTRAVTEMPAGDLATSSNSPQILHPQNYGSVHITFQPISVHSLVTIKK